MLLQRVRSIARNGSNRKEIAQRRSRPCRPRASGERLRCAAGPHPRPRRRTPRPSCARRGRETLTYGGARRADGPHRRSPCSGTASAAATGRDLRADLDQYGAAFCGILAAGAAVAPLAPSSTAASLTMMLKDSGAKLLLLDRETADALEGTGDAEAMPARRARRQRGGRAVLRLARPRKAPRLPKSRSRPNSRSTSSIRRARPARPRESSSRTACVGDSSSGSSTRTP